MSCINREPSEFCKKYQKSVFEREKNISSAGLCFTNDFDKALLFKRDLQKLIPDLFCLLSHTEIDTLIDFIADKTCEDLREKGFLSEESKQVLRR